MLTKQFMNIPIEAVRTFVAVAETGSLSKAGERFGISQPAVTAQMKRLQSALGGQLLTKSPNGTVLTALGKLALHHARRVLDSLDQLTVVAGNGPEVQPLRLGISAILLPAFIRSGFLSENRKVSLIAGHSGEIRRGLIEGYIDVGCGFASSLGLAGLDHMTIERQPIPLTWVRSSSFVVSPGQPLPIIGLPEDDFMMNPLQRAGQVFSLVLQTADFYSRMEGVRAGLGICAIPVGTVAPDIVVANEYYLPKLEPLDACICGRPDLEASRIKEIVPFLKSAIEACGASTKIVMERKNGAETRLAKAGIVTQTGQPL